MSASAQSGRRGTIHLKKNGKCVLAPGESMIYKKVDSMPQFPGGADAGNSWMRRNLVYPRKAMEQGLQGTVWVTFTVLPDGTISKPKIVESANVIFNDEALRLAMLMPKWKPGKCSGAAVAVQYKLPFRFTMATGNATK
jgi:protein TonB